MSKPSKAAAPAAKFVKPAKVEPVNRRGHSSIDNPVGNTWVACLLATAANSGELVTRREYTAAAIDLGVAYYTARTQVNRYLQWEAAGRIGKLPRGVVLG